VSRPWCAIFDIIVWFHSNDMYFRVWHKYIAYQNAGLTVCYRTSRKHLSVHAELGDLETWAGHDVQLLLVFHSNDMNFRSDTSELHIKMQILLSFTFLKQTEGENIESICLLWWIQRQFVKPIIVILFKLCGILFWLQRKKFQLDSISGYWDIRDFLHHHFGKTPSKI
jgi:hypothetical protein